VKEGILLTQCSGGAIEMGIKEMEKNKEEEIEEARKRLKQTEEGGYYVQAFLARVEFKKLLC